MAKDGHTEKATPHKRKESREKGQVLKSKEFNNLMVYIAFFIGVMFFQPFIAEKLYQIMTTAFDLIRLGMGPRNLVITLAGIAIPLIGGLWLLVLFFVMVNYMIQVGFLVSVKAVTPDPKRINPANYWKNIGNVRKSSFEVAKNIILFIVIFSLIFTVYTGNMDKIQASIMLSWADSVALFSSMLKEFAVKLGVVFLIIGIIDYFYQKYEYEENLKMKKEEVKDEMKRNEGSPEVKQQQKNIRNKMMEKQVKKKVLDAQVIIVNPTHYAVAIRYKKKEKDAVPRVVLKGVDELALLIKEIARENDIPVIENKPIARKIYAEIDEDDYISEELFEVVGKILAKLVTQGKVKLD